MPDPAPAVKAVFDRAAEIEIPADREAYLAEACVGHPDVRQKVDALLRAYADAGSFLEPAPVAADATATFGASPAAPTSDHPSRDEHAGAVIGGKYTLVELVGEGGMGSVWRAKQTEPVKRFVAVKLIKAGMDSRQVLARFEAERQALALMDHPHIAKVLDGGLHDGRPFFVMELVKGTPITDYCDKCKLTPRQRLELFVQACQAIQHAHQKGGIHRDIKPSNVLVALYDDRPVVKVIDFGVAKAAGAALTERTIDTGFGGVVGTPQYMSPEQATFNNLDIDTRSDVYALGVLLYDLLAGNPPFSKKELEQKGLLEILRVVREEEPPRPSTKLSTADALSSLSANRGTDPKALTGLLRNELDWIVMKALEKDRARRYETANGFAADVQRYLSGEAVQAHPPSFGYRLKKFVRRNRPQVVAASLVLVALLAGVVGTTWGLIRAERANADLAAKNAELDAERDKVQARFDTAVKAIETFHTGVSEDMLLKNPQFAELRTKLLKEAARFYTELERLLAGQTDPQSRRMLAAGYAQLGELTEKIGDVRQALVLHQKALALRRELAAAPGADVKTRLDVARSLHSVGSVLRSTGDLEAALKASQEQHDLAAALEAESPTDAVRLVRAHGHNGLGFVLVELGKGSEGLDAFRKALAVYQQLPEMVQFPQPGQGPTFGSQLQAGALMSIGRAQDGAGKSAGGLDCFLQATTIMQKLAEAHPDNTLVQSYLVGCHMGAGVLMMHLGKSEKAIAAWDKVLDIHRKMVKAHPAVTHYQIDLAFAHYNMGQVLVLAGPRAESLAAFRAGQAILQKLADAHPAIPDYQFYLAWGTNHVGRELARAKRFTEAFAEFERGLATNQKLLDANPAVERHAHALGQGLAYRGWAHVRAGHPAEVATDLRRTLVLWTKELLAEHESLFARARVLALLAGLAANAESGVTSAEGAKFADQAVATLREAFGLGWSWPGERRESDFDALRGRADFRKLLAEVETKAEKVPEAAPPPREKK